MSQGQNPMHHLSIAELAKGLRAKTFSSVELTEHFLQRIKRLDGEFNSFVTVTEQEALAQAKAADAARAAGKDTPLLGVPIAHKDIFCTQGVRTSCGSRMLENFVPPYDATIVDNYQQAGAVVLGKLNMDEFAMGSSNETSYFGAVKNPWDTRCVPGGSSGGSAAAVAARLTPGATASDTGGSIRQPASHCGLTGLKPTYGRVSRYGMIAFASSLDQAGVLTHSALDAAIMLNTLVSFDPLDSTSVDAPLEDYTADLGRDVAGMTIGVPQEYFGDGLNVEVAAKVQEAIDEFAKMGANIKEISLPHSELAVPAYYVIAPAECSANLSRFDGVRYGYRCDNPKDLEDLYKRSRSEAFGDEVIRRILVGTYALSAGYFDAYYKKAQQVRRLIKQDFDQAFADVDVIMGPTCPSPAFKLGAKGTDPVAMYLEDIYTIATNLAGLPGLSIPCGLVENKPVGLQLIGPAFAEQRLLGLAHQFQNTTDFHTLTAPGLE
ncbi:Asp-tRNA(Asn)/Glu-tRNA(Gln) amidotransferase subunit GatA [Halioxenophilus aromaticivorans]|uniref:Glutamyl-tRNA(Gln) amidotransferase subunit A n=2 Tax=Halioxenophilus aromaticivorans TaxID=1306992 RepID=A0AAV3U7C4_9ALTE